MLNVSLFFLVKTLTVILTDRFILGGPRMVFKNACIWPEDAPVGKSVANGNVAFYATEFEFTGPYAVLIPDEALGQSDMPKPKLKSGKWQAPCILIPVQKFDAIVHGHKNADDQGASGSIVTWGIKSWRIRGSRFHDKESV